VKTSNIIQLGSRLSYMHLLLRLKILGHQMYQILSTKCFLYTVFLVFHIYLEKCLTDGFSIDWSLSSGANSCPTTQEIPNILWNQSLHYNVHNSPATDLYPGSPYHHLTCQIQFNIILPYVQSVASRYYENEFRVSYAHKTHGISSINRKNYIRFKKGITQAFRCPT
jgi:hypothetical protein